ncbi:MAG: hypothetical protein ACRC37_03335, partial [Lentisphaeria bacterium]
QKFSQAQFQFNNMEYIQIKKESIDIWTERGKYEINTDLPQSDLKYLYEKGFTDIVKIKEEKKKAV